MQKGFTLIEIMIVLIIVAVLAAIAIPMYQDSLLRARTGTLSTEARALYVAMKQYQIDNHVYPDTSDFQLASFQPLRSLGYYNGGVGLWLVDSQADDYFGATDEFWLEMTLKDDSAVRFLVADSASAPLSGGDRMDGVYLYVNGGLQEVGQVN